MYLKYILRGALSFFVAGLMYKLIQPICRTIGVWSKDVLASAILGGVGAYYLGTFSDDADRVGKYAAIGFAIGGAALFGIREVVSLPYYVRMGIIGLFGGAGLGLGWGGDQKSALISSLSSALLVPLAFYINGDLLYDITGGNINVKASGMLTGIPIMLLISSIYYIGFAVLGGGLGAIMAYLDSRN